MIELLELALIFGLGISAKVGESFIFWNFTTQASTLGVSLLFDHYRPEDPIKPRFGSKKLILSFHIDKK